MNRRGGGPTHPEERDYEEGAPETGEWEAAIFFFLRPGGWWGEGFGVREVPVPEEVDAAGCQGADADGEEC